MAAEITQIDIQDFTSQEYENQDLNLIPTFEVNTIFSQNSYIEYFTYDINQNLLTSNYNFSDYTVLNDGQSAGQNNTLSQIEIDPEQVLINNGFDQGIYVTYFNFFNKQVGSNTGLLYITEISSDRTEIRLDSTTLSNLDIVEQTLGFINERENSEYFLDFYLNFGDNQLSIANNIVLDDQDSTNPTILIKLYDALPEEFDINSTLWIVSLLEESVAYQVAFEDEPIIFIDTVDISGPNFNLDIKDQVNNSTLELSYIDLISTSLTSSQNQLNSLLEEKEIDINIDYTSFENFIHFSSAQTRLENFYYKIQLIEQYSSSINILNTTTNSPTNVSSSAAIYENKINDIITNFDGYEYFLYYENNPYAWPKTNLQKPYILANSNDPIVLSWIGSTNEYNPNYGGLILSASLYDNNNKDNLLYTIPEYLRDDSENAQYELFVQMVAQHYDNIWIYYREVTQKYNADNRLEYGISKDIVADAIRDFGVKLYQNNFSNEDLFTAFLGITPEGGLFPFPNITGSLPTPSGFEYVDTLISASNDYIPLDDVNKSLYKRIYHNLPYLLKAKGTLPGLRALITSYGIPDTILRINEFGGKDKINSNDWDSWQDEFNYAFNTEGTNFISSSFQLNADWGVVFPSTINFRFKAEKFPPTNLSQSLIYLNGGGELTLQYTGSGLISGSYSGSIIDPYYQFTHLIFYPSSSNLTLSASIYLPIFNEGWWSVMLTSGSNGFTLYAGNNIYEGGDNNTKLGFYTSSSVTSSYDCWNLTDTIYFSTGSLFNQFSGSLQEIRYYKTELSESVFKDYIMNPYSIEGNSLNSSPEELVFRAPLGGELYTGSISIHPKITGSWVPTQSFPSDSNFSFNQTPIFTPNTEYFFADQPIAGIKNIINDKIRVEDNVLPEGDTLSPFKVLSQQTNISQSYTSNINYLEVSFSPQNEINEDIMSQIGYFNIGEFIGDPRLRSSSAESYPALDQLRNEYFTKYIKNYNLTDFIRLIKFFDNSLFKMIRDFVPARTSLASGIVIKQHLLERNKYPQPQMSWEDLDISGTLKPTWNGYEEGTVENFSGGTGGSFEQFNLATNTSQSWIENIHTISGSVLVVHNSQDEFYDGEFSGSTILISNGIVNEAYPITNQAFDYKPVHYYGTSSAEDVIFENNFLNSATSPQNGEILFFNKATFINVPFPPFNFTFYETQYLKIAKTDCNGKDNSLPLGEVTKVLIYNSFLGTYTPYTVTDINELPDYYLYEAGLFEGYLPSFPNQVLDYTISASKSTPLTLPLTATTPDTWDSSPAGTNLPHYGTPYFNTQSGEFTLENTPNTPLYITASITTDGNLISGNGNFKLIYNKNNNPIELASTTFDCTSLGVTSTLSASYYGIEGEKVYIELKRPLGVGSVNLVSASFLITQSRAVSASVCEPVIFEPYITTPNFYNSDENALLNSIDGLRNSSYYMDVDYTRGITTPVNFAQLISGSATRAKIPDSNYTTKRHIIPRYLGSRSTSQRLNTWSPADTVIGYSDIGTYGKKPTVESLKTVVAYAPFIAGWPPERENSSYIFVKYLIDQDGNVGIPNVSENSLANIQGAFQSGERVKISVQDQTGGDYSQYRTIIRGGTRIEPILYTQSGSVPNAQWATSISLTDNLLPGNIVGDYQAKLASSTYQINPIPNGIWTELLLNLIPSKGADASIINSPLPPVLGAQGKRYQINSGFIGDGISLTINVSLKGTDTSGYETYKSYRARIVRWRGMNKTEIISTNTIQLINDYQPLNFSYTIPFDQLQLNDELAIEVTATQTDAFYIEPSTITYNQSPTPDTNTSVSNLWISSSGTTTTTIQSYFSSSNPDSFVSPYLIYTTASSLVTYYGNEQVFQRNISESGFNPVVLPWSIKYGDEFRFEGREDRVYTAVQALIVPSASGNDSVLAVQLDRPIPVSGSLNLDHFLIRRYVDDASQILIEGFRPTGTTGPYIITPEYITPSLNKNVDTFITDLTQKGLL